MSKARITETEISEAVLRILAAKHDGEANQLYLRKRIPDYVKLSDEDRAPSETREGEEMWEQIVRNIVSHKTNEGNFVREGYLTVPSRGRLRITDSGRRRIS